ncbi:MAG: UDP-N-acetylglucosamine 1-carboxyvinyltransferase [Candidatus Marinimicrobia bacterium]|nr:UDP-N-acetylglucosamine 1-carboxyvinyltransferase [Candidatus Neomarinimicrobiota bacterium]MBL7010525.1 UDP-N-acetylglucosamine 1-carboxyvinyltransferase [Candidatus Neomarinimicrobiota bacterium]MBL7030445.1 UDP-N-acetylglucosamine 1-carboxyvinyltransferase [Candidatus Neomarinimicrobiota bacterium]
MDKFIINGGKRLSGSVEISGAKNAVLPIMAAALLADGKSVLNHVPDLRDTQTMLRLLNMIGAETEFREKSLTIDASKVNSFEAPYELVKTMRASFYVMGPLLARFGEARVSLPGGCAWGPRPVDYHLKGFEKLGAEVILEDGYIIARAKKLKGANIHFEIPSVGATGNIVMAAVLAEGITHITNAAQEPHIVQLCEVLNEMGADIEGVGTHELSIHGVDSLTPVEVKIIPDMIEAGTFLMAGATLGNITLKNVSPNHLSIVLQKLEQAGCAIHARDDTISIERGDQIEGVDMMTDVYPGFPTDLQAQWLALMSVATGSSIITDTIYHDRFSHVPELIRLGANISMENNVAVVRGVDKLRGAQVMSTDIRASASLVIAALMAEGRSIISRVYHIDRGYEKIEEKFKSLGADIRRETD